MMKKIGKLLLCNFVFGLISFTIVAKDSEVAVQELNTRSVFSYSEVFGKEYKMMSPFSSEITLGFDVRGRIYGYTSLNQFWGEAIIRAGSIEVKDLHTTEHKGTQSQRIEEVKYLTVLKDTEKLYFEGQNLVLETPFKEKLIFRRIK